MIEKAPRANCEVCPFISCQFVPSSGPEKSDLVIVGEGPGSAEVIAGMPFAARERGQINAGTILWKALGDLGIIREQVFVTNTVLCRPPGNRTPDAKETVPCRARLEYEVASREPKMILMLGNTALQTITGTKAGVTAGRLLDWIPPCYPSALGVTTFHPAFLLHNGAAANDFVNDMEKFISRLQGIYRPADMKGLQYQVVETYEQLEHILKEVVPPVAVDIETTGLSYREHEIVCISMGWDHHGAVIGGKVLKDPSARALLNARMNPLRQVFLNGKFDLSFLSHYGFSGFHLDDDVMLLSYALDERQGTHGLKYLSKEYLGVGDYTTGLEAEKAKLRKELLARLKAEGAKPSKKTLTKTDGEISYGDVPTEVLYPYAVKDAIYTRMLLPILSAKLETDTQRFYRNLLLPASGAVAHMESHGVQVDPALLEELGTDYGQQLSAITSELQHAWAGPEFNPNSSPQTVAVLKKLNLVGPEETSSDEEVLSQIRHPFAEQMLEHRGLQTKISRYINGIRFLKDRNNMVYPSYLLHGAVSRVSTKDPAIHQIPKEDVMRNLFIAPEGWEMLEADFCLVGDTLIETPGGPTAIRDIKVGDLVYSCVPTTWRVRANPVSSQACVGIHPVVRVTLDNGSYVDCTSEHKFMVVQRNPRRVGRRLCGSLPVTSIDVRAADLKVGMSVVPFHRRVISPNWGTYPSLFSRRVSKGRWAWYEHQIVAEAVYGPCPEGYEPHHIDEDKTNNRPENLVYKEAREHHSQHAKVNYLKQDHTYRKECHRIQAGLRDYNGKKNGHYGHRKGTTFSCLFCGKEVYRPPSRGGKYCSFGCYCGAKREGVNHKIVSVETLSVYQPVYSIEVERDHNYALTSGVFVRNSQHELRCCAHFSGDPFLMDIFQSEKNLHGEVAASLYGPNYTPFQYRDAKTLNFSILYGIGPTALAYRLGSSIGEAAKYIDDWFIRMPQVKAYLEEERRKATHWPYELTCPFGARRRFGLVTKQTEYDIRKKAGNWKIQRVASDLTLYCLIALDKILDPRIAKIIIFVHDALIFLVKDGHMQEVAPIVKKVMTELPVRLLDSKVPFKPDLKAGRAWGSLK